MEEDNSDPFEVRRRKLEALRASGIDPFPNDFQPSATTAEVLTQYAELDTAQLAESAQSVSLAGRIVGALRHFGKAAFLHLQDRAGRMQVYVKRDTVGENAFAAFKEMDGGDLIGISGKPFRTKTNELTIEAREIRLLAKALRPLPEKWHGLTDVEARYRQRYLDLISNETARTTFRRRAEIIQIIREFFTSRDYIEVETPMMQPIAGGAVAKPFVTHHKDRKSVV